MDCFNQLHSTIVTSVSLSTADDKDAANYTDKYQLTG